MRLLILINNYMGDNSTNSEAAVDKVLQTFASYTQIDVDIVLFSTSHCAGRGVINLIYPPELSYAFAFVPRQWLVENFCCLSHEYYMYTENDLIIPESAVLNCIHLNAYLSRFSNRLTSGFIRYEQKEGEEKVYIDMLPCARPTVEKTLQSDDGHKFWVPGNIHSGNFFFSRNQLARLIDGNLFQTRFAQYGKSFGGILESAASDVYIDFVKVLPKDFTKVEIEHISNKYVGLTHQELSREVETPSGKIGC
ncbi:MAG: hypothetical protein P8X96_21650 [Desulfobacteraceae bacterium]